MPEKQTCQKKNDGGNLICNHEIYDAESGLCIFHCKEKPVEEFREAFLKELEKVNMDEEIKKFDCRFFVFPSRIDLADLELKKKTNFYKATFGNETNFDEATFGDGTDFHEATFGNETSFERATFGDESNFNGATFGDNTSFHGAIFRDKAFFYNAIFGDKTFFDNVTFVDSTDFYGTTFGCDTVFEYVKFGYDTFFNQAKFGDNTSFEDSTFGDKTFFDNVTFGDNTSFKDSIFKGNTRFANNKIKEEKEWSIDFVALIIINPKDFKFDHFNIKKVSLKNTDWTEVEFLGCTWPKAKKRDYVVYDELKDKEKKHLPEIKQLYHRLQTNFENNKCYDEAGDFYIGSMEMRRLQIAKKSNKVWRWIRQNVLSVMGLYRMVSLYGERYIRPLWWLVAIILLFPFLYIQAGFDYYDQTTPGNPTQIVLDFNHLEKFYSNYKKGLAVSFHASTFQRNSKFFELDIGGTVVYILQSALSASIITLFLLALRRKFGRK